MIHLEFWLIKPLILWSLKNNKMKKSFIILALFIATIGFSQTAIKKSSIDSGGTSITNGTTSVLYTIGEVAVQENTQGTIHLSEGFISSDILAFLGISDDYSLLQGVHVYPNPSVDFVNFKFTDEAAYTLSIFDYSGKEIKKMNTQTTNLYTINLSRMASGLYIIVVTNSVKKQYNTFKILKE